MASARTIMAAGGVVWRPRLNSDNPDAVQLLVAHRPRYGDWTFPKGKQDPGETLHTTAVREIEEETGIRVRLGAPLPDVHYRVSAGPKKVVYWTARLDIHDPGYFTPNREVDEIRWLRPRDAKKLLSYSHDLRLLQDFRRLRSTSGHRTRTLVVVRHGKARSRSGWKRSDTERPLATLGAEQAASLVPVLSAYGIEQVVSSPAVRCARTVEPYGSSQGAPVRLDGRFAEDARRTEVSEAVHALMDDRSPAVVCTHRPTLPSVFAAIGIDSIDLAPGQGVVVHHRRGRVVATEMIGG